MLHFISIFILLHVAICICMEMVYVSRNAAIIIPAQEDSYLEQHQTLLFLFKTSPKLHQRNLFSVCGKTRSKLTHLFPPPRALSTLRGLRGAPEVPPLCRETQSLGQQMLELSCENATVGTNRLTRKSFCHQAIVS